MKIKILFVFVILFFTARAKASGGHDSLLFDASGEVKVINSVSGDDCKITVTKVSGFVLGAKTVREIYEICGEWDTINRVETAAQLKVGDNIVKKEEIKTGEDGFVKMELTDGSVIVVGPNSSLFIDEEMCETSRTLIKIKSGSIWTKIKKLLGGGKFEVSTENGGGGVRGTEFTYDVLPDKDVVKVYEGSFEVNPPKDYPDLEDYSKEMEQLQKDYEAGKVTMEELISKMAVITEKTREKTVNIKSTMVEAGYMATINKTACVPEPIPPGETKWFEDPRIK